MTQVHHEQLKPCPFCGDADALRHSMITGAVFCEGCGCEGPWAPHFDGDWGTRAAAAPSETLAQVRALLEALRDSRKSTPREVHFARNALIDLAVTEGRA